MKKVAILCTNTVPWINQFQDAIRSYAKAHGDWYIFGLPASHSGLGPSGLPLESMKGWKGDGIIISSNDVDELRYAKSMKIPVLNLAGGLPSNHGILRIMTDHYAAGRLAAEHMIDRGLFNMAYFGWEDRWYSQERCRGFQDYAEQAGAICHVLLRPPGEDITKNWASRIAFLVKWLSTLPLPCGIFAVQDYRAQLVIEACHEAGLRVPYDIAVVGMDNDSALCEHTVPKLSSVTRNAFELGCRAASLLDLMMQGKPVPCEDILVPPIEVIIRESSDTMYCSDPVVRAAMDYMREHLSESFNIEIVADHVGVSKRTLETRFSTTANSSPRQCLTKMRVQEAQKLMRLDPQTTLDKISSACGFGSAPTFYSAFQRFTGTTPAGFRDQLTNTPNTCACGLL